MTCVNCVPDQKGGIWMMCGECGEALLDSLEEDS